MLLVGPPMPERSRMITQTKRGTLVLQVGSWAWGSQLHPVKKYILKKPQRNEAWRISWQRHWAIYKSLRLRTRNKLEFNIGTLNVRSLYIAEALRTLTNQLSAYKGEFVALQAIWWTGSRILDKWDCTLFYSCDNKDHILGMGFLVSKRIKRLIIDFKPITPKICTLRMRGIFKITV